MLNYILSLFRRKPVSEPNEGELQIIRLYAKGNHQSLSTEARLREESVSIYNKYISLRHKYIELQYMSEETSKYPDLALKFILQAKLRHIEAALSKAKKDFWLGNESQ